MVAVRKFYVRYREGIPELEAQFAAREGFRQLGVELGTYSWIDDIKQTDGSPKIWAATADAVPVGAAYSPPPTITDLAPDVGVCGYIGDVWAALDVLGRPRPAPIDYPQELFYLRGRKIWRTTLGEVRATLQPLFVKPVEHKVFTGFVHRGDGESRMRIVTQPDAVECWASEVVPFVSEHRAFVLRGEVVDVRRYKGDWWRAPDQRVVHEAVTVWRTRPVACCLDFGVTQEGHTLLVEANDGFAFGTYGLAPTLVAQMLSARWFEMAGGVS